MSPDVLLTVITPVLNRSECIDAALASVSNTETGEVEHLVVDGGSHDGTRERVMNHRGAQLIDAPGSSLYQAINLGIHRARGTWIALLNSDDEIAPGGIGCLLPLLRRSQADGIRGRVRYRWQSPGEGQRLLPVDPHRLTLETILFGGPAINAIAFRRTAMERIGAFDESLKIAADREWLLRAYADNWTLEYSDLPFYVYALHPGSLTLSQDPGSSSRWTAEHVAIAQRYLRRWPRLSSAGRSVARWHAQETSRLALQRLRQHQGLEAFSVLLRGVRESAFLPLWVFAAAATVVGRRLHPGPQDSN